MKIKPWEFLHCLGFAAWHGTNLLLSKTKSGFAATEILPFDAEIFINIDFMSSFVSYSEIHLVAPTSAAESTYAGVATVNTTDRSAQATRVSPHETSTATIPDQLSMKNTMIDLVPYGNLRPYPNGQAGKDSDRGRPKERCMITTDTPQKMLIKKKKKKMPIKRRLFEAKLLSFEDEDNFSAHSGNFEID
ncbi:hypothetical protein ILUMI_13932 [Ignelater luminosus]|uniref:Uncharacterized protein n=1 Tax=Ignelater luminosus TaxID=2038154 RepID=A0A8K0G879_IGNLU|nr:hypothetical protein ILUMI_13932 [Ignelater luminosus]